MKIPDWLACYGDQSFRGKCPPEEIEQATFFARLRRQYPESWGKIALHPRNEGKRNGRQFRQLEKDKALGLTVGASDIIIPGSPSFICELKRRDHTKSQWQDGQQEYLTAASNGGGFVCVAFGCDAAWEAFEEWLSRR